MLRSRFLWKIYACYVALILLTTATVGFLVSHRISRTTLEATQNELKSQALFLRVISENSLQGITHPSLEHQVIALGKQLGTRLTVIRANGEVIADSDEDPAVMDNHADRPEILATQSGKTEPMRRYSETLQTMMIYLALPVQTEGRLYGYVRTSLSLTEIDNRLREIRDIVILGAFLATIVALCLGFIVTRKITAPLISVTSVAESISKGEYEKKVQVTSQDEIGDLARALNAMTEQLSQRMDTIIQDRNKVLAILGSMSDGLVSVDDADRIIHMNLVAGKIFGVPPEESLGKKILEVTRLNALSEALDQAIQNRTTVRSESTLLGQHQDQVIEMEMSPLQDSEGNPAGAVIVLNDVTELRRLESVRRDFVSNVSHELKTPTTAISGLIETLLDDKKMPMETQSHFLKRIREQTKRLSTLINDLLTLARLESAQQNLFGSQPLDLRDPLLTSLQSMQSIGEEKEINIETVLPDAPVIVLGDEEAIRQLINNLLDNALKYTPREGQVWIRLGTEDDSALIQVEDTGIGIEPIHRERIFERFYRVDKARSRELGGTGLGLSIVKHICLSHGGKVSLQSQLGKGSTFLVSLPLAK